MGDNPERNPFLHSRQPDLGRPMLCVSLRPVFMRHLWNPENPAVYPDPTRGGTRWDAPRILGGRTARSTIVLVCYGVCWVSCGDARDLDNRGQD